MRIGLFGGTFNPIHLGHLRAAEEAREKAALQKVIFIPSGNPPLKSEGIISAASRLRLVRTAVADNPYFEVSDIEVNQQGKSYTVDTVEKMLRLYNNHELFFITGIDAFLDMPLWHRPESIISMIDFIVLTRPGYSVDLIKSSDYIDEASLNCLENSLDKGSNHLVLNLKGGRSITVLNITAINISSTILRECLKTGRSLRYLVPETILNDIRALRF